MEKYPDKLYIACLEGQYGDDNDYIVKTKIDFNECTRYEDYYSYSYLNERIADKVAKILGGIYQIGEEVWYIDDNKVHKGTIEGSNICTTKEDINITYLVRDYGVKSFESKRLFRSKEDLLKSL